ncbi:uncharacterized protein BYT42DRAFT_493442 [Radiomyces spectabilis]|uniref:uncharacterized protein n=1 Tax=Radiomyces spectabilis TaxID=64574 RepID=UPI00222001E1|nr:uncharacterized protein BYT42DRAFT_493442 [Radiomyces spectabilis]KAI8384354.1 hypothetical protein BYT42DRAFT_493442 [Radiomyces spectabilis]
MLSLSKEPLLRRKEVLGMLLMVFSALLFTFMTMFVKMGSEMFPSFELVLVRSLIQTLLALGGCAIFRINPLGKPGIRKWLLFRAIVGAIGLALFFYSLSVLSLSDATVLFFLGPTFTAILASVILNESFTLFDSFCSVLCLVGLILVSKPMFLYNTVTHDQTELQRIFAISCAIAGAIMSAIAYVTVRKVGKGTHILVHAVYLGIVSSIISVPGILLLQEFVWPQNVRDYIILVFVGLFAFIGQYVLNEGLKLAPAGGTGTLMQTADVAFAFLFGVLVFSEYPDVSTLLGSALIVGMTTALSLHRWHTRALHLLHMKKKRRSRTSSDSHANTTAPCSS